jgi:hypothetical protein
MRQKYVFEDVPIGSLRANASTDGSAECNCLAVRQAARHITQFYDQHLAAAGLRTTQYGILAKLKRHGPMSINALAAWTAPRWAAMFSHWNGIV